MGGGEASRRASISARRKSWQRLAFLGMGVLGAATGGGCVLSWDAVAPTFDASGGELGGAPDVAPAPPRRTLRGTVLNLRGTGLVLTCNGTDDLTLPPSATAFAFATPVAEGRPYTIEVRADPTAPVQACVVGNGKGLVPAEDVTNITVDCTTEGYTLRANVTGLVGMLTLANGTDVVSVRESGTVAFSRNVPTGQLYDLRVVAQPATQRCRIREGAGTMGAGDVLALVQCFDDFVEHFDAAAELPPGWGISVLAQNGDPPWFVASEGAYSPPNALRVVGVPRTLDTVVTSPPIPIVTDTPQLVFRHAFEAAGFDGAVLEIKVDDGPFVDILAAAGPNAFESFGYNAQIASLLTNPPLDDRPVWSGTSGGYVTTIANLPTDAAGKTIQLRWRWGNDGVGAAANSGWRVDDVVVHR